MPPPREKRNDSHLYCPVAATMDLLMGKWTLHILRELMDGKKRFNELGRSLERSVSSRTLCSRLRALEGQGILRRHVRTLLPPWVEYELTEKGQALNAVIDSIVNWSMTYMRDEVSACLEIEEADARVPAASPAPCCPEQADAAPVARAFSASG
jgi:DNA-binding HxlR family transcriptional regulator